MQLRHLTIPRFRNLRGVAIDFAVEMDLAPGCAQTNTPKAIRSHALIGQNGVGKSNLIEALITIFRDVDLNRDAAFDYTLEYEIRGHIVRIEANLEKQQRPFVWVDGDRVTQDYLSKNDPSGTMRRDERRGPRLLPSHVFAYYSGRNERIEELFRAHQDRFNRLQEISTDEVLPEGLLENFRATAADIRAVEEARRRRELRIKNAGDDRLRRLFYCRGGHSQLVLLACLLSHDSVFQKVLKNLHIEALESALFVLKEPYRLRERRQNRRLDEVDLNEGDPRFWFARGSVVSEFLDSLWKVAWAPIEQEVTRYIDFRGSRTEKQKQLYLFVPNQEKLHELGRLVGGVDSFFRYAEGAYIGDLIEEVRITVKKRDEYGGAVSFTQLSEGELQMLTVLGLMRITRDDHCLFLLDEPDTHLNPIWKLRYFDDIEGVLAADPEQKHHGHSQILITTHDPMMVGSLRREQVHILRREGDSTVVHTPYEHPQGMGVAGLLKSELFGLPSTLDPQTLDDLQRRNELIAKKASEGLTAGEEGKLQKLRRYLEELGFSHEYRDPMYQLFVEKMYKAKSQPINKLLTPEELAEQEALAESIVKQLVASERKDELAELARQLKQGGA
ncbi:MULTISPECIES: AAA family ATPase [Xanthomonas]|uniref:AAA family ATPase n=1 Tax=Xanthomonas euroxanthea TaxID=2259622 RepID=UPI00160D000A|nr:AAA family ATPase [Xanthomonas euroxanthea]MCC4613164.1 AAA family ATPase [Xanthomonas campestris pv. esculenti]CAG2086374.1 AAA family ATPase [Xanthomonas euroxanthea]